MKSFSLKNAPLTGVSPSECKKKNIVLVHKKSDKQNYRPVSLLPIYGTIFERLAFNEMLDLLSLIILFHQTS